MRAMSRVLALAIVGVTSLLVAGGVSADQAYHTERLTFEPVGDAPALRAGQVINAHSNGRQRYAHEQYLVNGATPNTTYQVMIEVYADPTCETPMFALPTALLETGANGQASANAVFVPSDVSGLAPIVVGARWVLREGDILGDIAYQTRCTVITLDAPPA